MGDKKVLGAEHGEAPVSDFQLVSLSRCCEVLLLLIEHSNFRRFRAPCARGVGPGISFVLESLLDRSRLATEKVLTRGVRASAMRPAQR